MAAAEKARTSNDFALQFDHRSHVERTRTMAIGGRRPPSTPAYHGHSTPSLVPNSSAAWATAAYLYLNLVFFDGEWTPGGHGNSVLLRWLLDWVQVDSLHRMNVESNSGELWLWRHVIGAYALTVAGWDSLDANSRTDNEGQREMIKLVGWYADRLRTQRRPTWDLGWDAVLDVLEKIHWLQEPSSHGELVLEKLWRDAVDQGSDA